MTRLLHPAQVEWHGLGALPTAIAVAAALLAVVLWLYPRQVRVVDNPWRWLLPGLRGAALVVLALSMLKPVVLRSRLPEEAGAVAIVIDRSRSMGVVDASRDDADLVRLADGLGLLPPDIRPPIARRLPASLHELRAQIDLVTRALSELRYAELAGRDTTAAQQRWSDAQRLLRQRMDASITIADSIDDATIADRLRALAEAAAHPQQDQWLATINQGFDAAADAVNAHVADLDRAVYAASDDVREICDALRDQSRLDLVAGALTGETGLLRSIWDQALVFGFSFDQSLHPLPLHSGGQPVTELSLAADGARSHVSSAVPRTLEHLSGRPVHAVVLLSDGRQVGAEARVVSSLVSGDAPVIAVLAAPPSAPLDAAITRIHIPDSLFAAQEAIIRADIRLSGTEQATCTVRLRAAGQTHEQQVVLRGEHTQTVTFPLIIDNSGIQDIHIDIEPLDREASLENNTATRRIKVLADRTRIIALAGTPTWDFQYLRNLLERSEWVTLTDAILAGGAPAAVSPEDILNADVVILADVSAASLNVAQRDAIHRLVTERGGSVILVAGDAHLPEEYSSDVLLAALLPWRGDGEPTWRQWPGEIPGFRPIPVATAATGDLLRLDDDADIAAAWNALPPIFRILAIPELKPNARPLLSERDSSLPLLTEARLGAGRVYFAAFNESWRWRYKTGDARHSRFWRQLVRHAAESPYAVTNDRYAFDIASLSIEPDQPLRVRAKRLDDSRMALRVRVAQEGQIIEERRLDDLADDPRRAEAVFAPPPPGDYQVHLLAGDDQPQLTLPMSVRTTLEPELLDLSPDPALLRRLAESSGGMMLSLDSMDQIAPYLRQLTEKRPSAVRQPLWDSPYLFGFVLGCLSLEWAMRKRLGLV